MSIQHLCYCSVIKLCLNLCDSMDCSTPGFPAFHSHVHWAGDAIQPSHPLSSPSFAFSLSPSIFPNIRFLSNELAHLIRWPKDWSFSFSNSPSSDYSGSISFRIDWFDLFAVQETLKSLLQNHNLKASILWCLAFFMVQFSHPYMTTGKIVMYSCIALTV